MDLAMALAAEVDADLVVANDPDADRCAVAVPGPHGWRMLRGDEVGALLADFLLRSGVAGRLRLLDRLLVAARRPREGARAGAPGDAHRLQVDRPRPGLAFGYEEALGYCVAPDLVKDKDGVSALLRVVELAAQLKAEGRTLGDRLDDIAREHGLYATDQLSVRVTDLAKIADAMAQLRTSPPETLGGLRVERVDDLAAGSSRAAADRGPALPPRRGRPGDRAAVRDRAEDQVLPGGRRPGRGGRGRAASTPPASPRPAGSTRSGWTWRRPPACRSQRGS